MRIRAILVSLCSALIFSGCSAAKKMQKQLSDRNAQEGYFKGILVVDAKTGKTLIDYNSDKYFTPASNTKLFTLYTALINLGDSLPGLRYIAIGDSLYFQGTANPAVGAGWADDKTLTFLKHSQRQLVYVPQAFDQQVYGSGWAWDDAKYYFQRPMDAFPLGENKGIQSFKSLPDSLSVAQLSQALQRRVSLDADFDFPPFPKVLYSIATDSVYKELLQQSDNFVAEQLMLMVGKKRVGVYQTQRAIAYARDELMRQLPQKPNWVDGSGLSRYNLLTPQDMIWVLQRILQLIGLQRIRLLFPDETLLFDYPACVLKPGVSRLFAKSGTLLNNYNLSGYLITKSGRILLFSYMNNHFLKAREAIKAEMIVFLKQLYGHF